METLKLILKGMVIGIGKIIPGVSGSMIAISLGLYERMIHALCNIFNNFKENAVFLFKVGIGLLLSIMLISKIIYMMLNNYYLLTMLLFIGLILGGLPSIIKIASKEKNTKNNIILLIPFVIFLILEILTDSLELNIKLNMFNAIWVGMLEALTMLIPGISGTAIMMMLGIYEDVLLVFSEFNYFHILIFLMLGIMLGVFFFSKLINYFLNKHKISCYYLIIGFVVSSIIILLKNLFIVEFKLLEFIIGIILMIIGMVISYKFE